MRFVPDLPGPDLRIALHSRRHKALPRAPVIRRIELVPGGIAHLRGIVRTVRIKAGGVQKNHINSGLRNAVPGGRLKHLVRDAPVVDARTLLNLIPAQRVQTHEMISDQTAHPEVVGDVASKPVGQRDVARRQTDSQLRGDLLHRTRLRRSHHEILNLPLKLPLFHQPVSVDPLRVILLHHRNGFSGGVLIKEANRIESGTRKTAAPAVLFQFLPCDRPLRRRRAVACRHHSLEMIEFRRQRSPEHNRFSRFKPVRKFSARSR